MIDALFGSKTRVKLLHLFLNNPGQSFYVREITRLIGEQINSVRRELANMINVGIVTSDGYDNKLYYQVNQSYEHYLALRAIFGNEQIINAESVASDTDKLSNYESILKDVAGIRQAIVAGEIVGSGHGLDLMLVGDIPPVKVKNLIKYIEHHEGREINYTVLSYDDFYYRLSIRDKFIIELLKSKHVVLVDKDNIVKEL